MEIRDKDTIGLWHKALAAITREGKDYKDNDGRICREMMNLVLVLESPDESGVDGPINAINDSRKWVYPTKEELSSIMFKEIQAPIYDYTYGGRIFNFAGKIDQLNGFVIPLLKRDNYSRRATLMIYDPEQDSNLDNKNTPGILYIQFSIRNKLLYMSCAIRSNDMFFGWPANIFQLFNLQKFVASKLDVELGEITTISNSAHTFHEDFSNIEEIAGRKT